MSTIAVPVTRPQPREYVGRHRAVGEQTAEIRPKDLAEDNGPTRRLNTTSSVATAVRAVWTGVGVR